MTNNEIILEYKVLNNLELDMPLHTYEKWKSLGYQVKKGEKSQHKITIWKHTSKKVVNEDGEEVNKSKCFPKLSAFFTLEQVEKIKA